MTRTTSKKIVSVLLVFLMLVGIMPFAPAVDTKVSAAGSRDTVVAYMRSMATIKWTPQKTITYYAQDGRKYYAGTTYTGIPYTQNNRQNLATFKSKLSGSTYVGATTPGGYVGNDCSSAVMYSWKQITDGISFSYTGNMFPESGTGVKKVGSYNANSTTNTKKITTGNGKNTMFASYAQLKPGDAIVARVSGVVNHTRIISSVGSSYVTCIEQCGLSSSRGATTWNVDKKYTFDQLYSTYYIPITCTALQNATGGGNATGPSTLSISSYNTPSSLAVGKSFSIYGTISSNYTIKSVTVGIYNANGGTVSAKTVSPNSTYFSISTVDNYIKFGQAKAGTNYYKVVATDAKKTATLVNKAYTVGSSGSSGGANSTLSIADYNFPTSLVVGKSYTIKGTVKSNYKITSLTVGIYNANGGAVSTKTVKPNATSYSIKNVDAYIKFGLAKVGTNYYKIVATDAKQTKTLLNKAYTVTGQGGTAASTLSLSGYNYPTNLGLGKSYSIKGTISSNYKITSVTVGIYNANGGAVSAKTVSPNAKSYSLSKIDAYIKFGAAKSGTNYYKISATDTKKTATLLNKAYKVGGGSSAASTLSISGYNVPSTLALGKSFSIKGTVKSNYKITSLTVGIYNANGGAVSTKTVSPNATSYSIANVDKYIIFGKAGAGTNYYKITATDTKTTKTLVNQKYKVSGGSSAASTLSLSGYNVPPTLAVGKSFSIKGKVTSNYKISSVTVGIYNSNGGAVSTKTVKPGSTSFNIATVDANIKFGAAKAGTNYYKIVATDAKQTKTLLNHAYSVTGGSSSSSASTLKISGHNTPGTLSLGASFSIYGTVSSNYNISSLTVGIYNSNGGAVSTKTVKPNAKSYSIKNVDKYIKFGAAKAGTNYYKVVATDSKQTKTLLNHKYTVKSGGGGGSVSPSGGSGADRIVEVAKSQVGVSGRPNKYTRWYGTIGGSYSYAWCATFVSWCASQAGVASYITKTASCYWMADGFSKKGTLKSSSYNPVKGDILFFDNSSTSGAYNHVGIVVSYNASTGAITTVEGNTSSASQANGNTVAIKTRYKNTRGFKVSAFAHPGY